MLQSPLNDLDIMTLNSASPDTEPMGPHLPVRGEELISMCPEIPIFPWDCMFQVHYLKCLESMSIRATVCSGIWHSTARLMWQPTRSPGSSRFSRPLSEVAVVLTSDGILSPLLLDYTSLVSTHSVPLGLLLPHLPGPSFTSTQAWKVVCLLICLGFFLK